MCEVGLVSKLLEKSKECGFGICVSVRLTFRKPWTVFVWSLWCLDRSERVSLFISPSKHATEGLREFHNNAAEAPDKPLPEGSDSLPLTHHPVRSEGTQSLPALSTFTFSNQFPALVLTSFIQAAASAHCPASLSSRLLQEKVRRWSLLLLQKIKVHSKTAAPAIPARWKPAKTPDRWHHANAGGK